MAKQKILLLIQLVIIGGLLMYTWIIFLSSKVVGSWRQYASTVLFIILVFLFFKNFKASVFGAAFYLVLCSFNLLALAPSLVSNSYGLGIGSMEIWTPKFSLLAFGLLLLFLVLNFDTLVNIYLDYKEKKEQQKK